MQRRTVSPEKEKLSQVSERLQEVDREYELSLQAISDKEKTLSQRGSHLTLLQKQVKDLRYSTSTKDRSLMRAAKILGEYKLALQEAQFRAVKKTVPTSSTSSKEDGEGREEKKGEKRRVKPKDEVVEVLTRSANMERSMRRLSDLLEPFVQGDPGFAPEEDSVLAMEERERHVMQLHKRVAGLKNNLESTEVVALNKVKMAYDDNKELLEEVNSMRQRIKKLTNENQRQKALIDMMNIRSGSSNSMGDSAFGAQPGGFLGDGSVSQSLAGGEGGGGGGQKPPRQPRSYEGGNIPGAHMYSRDDNDRNYAQASSQVISQEPSLSRYPLGDGGSAVNNMQYGGNTDTDDLGMVDPSDALGPQNQGMKTGHYVYRQDRHQGAPTGKNVAPKNHNGAPKAGNYGAIPGTKYLREETPLTAESRERVMKSADDKIAMIMAENQAKISEMGRGAGADDKNNFGGSSAQDILMSYQSSVPSLLDAADKTSSYGAAHGGTNTADGKGGEGMSKREVVAAQGGIGKQPGPHNKGSRAINAKQILLPEI